MVKLVLPPVWIAEIDGDVDLLEFGGADPLPHSGEMVRVEGEGEVDLGPQLWRTVRDRVPVLANEAQVHHPSIEDLRVGLNVSLEDPHQDLGGELRDWSGPGSGTFEGNVLLSCSGHLY